jgi:hypothetical protein
VFIVLLPTFKAIGADVDPLKSVAPFTVKVALASLVTGVTVTEEAALLTVSV